MSSLHRYASRPWTTPYSPLRAYWLLRGVYVLLAADLWFEMIQHGGRYGLGGFNVTHFAWLDALLPLPTPALYVGLLIAAGTISLLLALGPAPRWLRALLTVLYTWSWLLSVHDSYQHHYLLSWLLCWCVFVPELSARRALAPEPVNGWGFPMTAVTCSIVYFFTGVSKSEPEWRSGDALRSITRSAAPGATHPGKFDGARDLLVSLGFDDQSAWQVFALATIALQWIVALGYLASIGRDPPTPRWRVLVCSLALLAALSFHAIAELFHVFEIGLFSFYMMWIACLFLGPARLFVWPTRGLVFLSDLVAGRLAERSVRPSTDTEAANGVGARDLVRPLLAAALLLAVGFTIPLPGAPAATALVAACVSIWSLRLARAGSERVGSLDRLALNSTLSAFLLWLALTQSSVPFDYYRRTAGELQRMGRLSEALSLYRLAERYAPSDKSRAGKIRELERELEQSSAKRRF